MVFSSPESSAQVSLCASNYVTAQVYASLKFFVFDRQILLLLLASQIVC